MQLIIIIILQQCLSRLVVRIQAIEIHEFFHYNITCVAPVTILKDTLDKVVLVDRVWAVSFMTEEILEYDIFLFLQILGGDGGQD